MGNKIFPSVILGAALVTEVVGILCNAAILLRLLNRTGACAQLTAHGLALTALALARVFLRTLYVALNQLVPFSGTCMAPLCIARVSAYRRQVSYPSPLPTGGGAQQLTRSGIRAAQVGLMERLDLCLTMILAEDLGFGPAMQRSLKHLLATYGPLPRAQYSIDHLLVLPTMVLVFLVGVPLLIVGLRLRDRRLQFWGATVLLVVFVTVQFVRPISSNVYYLAGYRFTQGADDVLKTKGMAAQLFTSKALTGSSPVDGQLQVDILPESVEAERKDASIR
jgi:hypothetical protein